MDHRTSSRKMWRERRSIRQHFTWGGFTNALVLGLIFSALDVGSDIAFAEEDHTSLAWSSRGYMPPEHVTTLTYLFMSMPGLVMAYSCLQATISSCLVRVTGCKEHSCTPICNGLINLVSIALLVGEVFLVIEGIEGIKYLAISTAVAILAIKVIALFVQTNEMKKLSIKASMAESSFESRVGKN